MATLPPGPTSPRVVQLLRYTLRPLSYLEECARAYGDCFTLEFPRIPGTTKRVPRMTFVLFSDPEAIRDIFTGDGERLRAGDANSLFEHLLGRHSLLFMDGERHLRERRMMQPPFHGERMQAYGEVMRDITDAVIDGWPLGRPFPIHAEMQRITLEVILRTVFGVDQGPRLTRLRDLLTTGIPMGSKPWNILFPVDLGPWSPGGRLARIGREVDELLFAEIARRRADGAGERPDVLSMLVEARDEQGHPMTDQELRDEMFTLLVGGHETTATSLAWVFHRLLEHPDVLGRVREELDRVVGRGPLAPAQVAQLEYLDAVTKETLRLNPILPAVSRHVAVPMRIGGHDLPAGVIATACIYLAHRRPDLWPDAERFQPERFVGARPNPYVFFPFGGGVRRCLGAAFALYEMKVVLAETLRRISLRAAPGYQVRAVLRGVTLAPSAGMPVVAESLAA
jgi:cytochrome P450